MWFQVTNACRGIFYVCKYTISFYFLYCKFIVDFRTVESGQSGLQQILKAIFNAM